MTRRAHLWFFLGIFMALAAGLTAWLLAVLAGQVWSTQWGLLVPIVQGLLVFAMLRRWIANRRARQRMHEWTSHEMRCKWDWPEEGHRLRVRFVASS